jgi:hypothetical protein
LYDIGHFFMHHNIFGV